MKVYRQTDGQKDEGQQAIREAHLSFSSGELRSTSTHYFTNIIRMRDNCTSVNWATEKSTNKIHFFLISFRIKLKAIP